MSKYLALALVVSLMGVGGMAFGAEGAHHRDGYSMKNGKVVVTRDGKETEVTAEVSLGNGSRLLPDGVIITRDGRRDRFVEGKWLTFDGDFVALDDTPVIVDDGYFWRDDHLYVVRGGVETIVTTEIVLDDGTRLLPDGFIVAHDGSRRHFDAGMRLSLQGKVQTGTRGGVRSPEDIKPTDTSRKLEGNTNNTTPNTNNTNPSANRENRAQPETRTAPGERERPSAPEHANPGTPEHANPGTHAPEEHEKTPAK